MKFFFLFKKLKNSSSFPKCKTNRESTKQLTISQLPFVTCIHLKRFEHTWTGTRNKIQTMVKFDEKIDMKSFVSSNRNDLDRRVKFNKNSDDYTYKVRFLKFENFFDFFFQLFAVVNHQGTLQSGHYTCFIKQASNSWFKCDDSLVTKAAIEGFGFLFSTTQRKS